MKFSELFLTSIKSVFFPKKVFKQIPDFPKYSLSKICLIVFLFGVLHEITHDFLVHSKGFIQITNFLHVFAAFILPIYVGTGLVALYLIYSAILQAFTKANSRKIHLAMLYFTSVFFVGNIFDLPHFFGLGYIPKTKYFPLGAFELHLAVPAIVILGSIQLYYIFKYVIALKKDFWKTYFIFSSILWASAALVSNLIDIILPKNLVLLVSNNLGIVYTFWRIQSKYLAMTILVILFAVGIHFLVVRKNKLIGFLGILSSVIAAIVFYL